MSQKTTGKQILHFPRGVRLHFDKSRDRWVLLGPERMYVLDSIACEILKQVNGEKDIDDIITALSEQFNQPRDHIASDISDFIKNFQDRRMVEICRDGD